MEKADTEKIRTDRRHLTFHRLL